MNIVIVENDYLQYDWMEDVFRRYFPDWNVSQIKTELEFRNKLEQLAVRPPNVIIMDVMLQWTTPSENVQRPPKEVSEGGHHTAGLRCEELLRKDKRTEDIPVILYTVLERADLEHRFGGMIPPYIKHLRKESEPDSLFALIHEITARRHQ